MGCEDIVDAADTTEEDLSEGDIADLVDDLVVAAEDMLAVCTRLSDLLLSRQSPPVAPVMLPALSRSRWGA